MTIEYKRIMTNAGLAEPKASDPSLFSTRVILCPMCLGPIHPHYEYCYHCRRAIQGSYSHLLPDNISFLTYAGATDQSRLDFYNYKAITNQQIPNPGLLRLQALVKDFVDRHAKCMANLAHLPVDLVAVVPSGKTVRFTENSAINKLLGLTNTHIIQRKTARKDGSRDDGIDPSRYNIVQNLTGQHVLLFEDTWVTGANPLSSAVALKQAGAQYVSLIVLGRYIAPANYPIHAQWLSENRIVPYDVNFCPVTRSYQCPSAFRPVLE